MKAEAIHIKAGRGHWRRARKAVRKAIGARADHAYATITTRRGAIVGCVAGEAGDPELGWTYPWYLHLRGGIGPTPR